MATSNSRRLNRWALRAQFECSPFDTVSAFGVQADSRHSTILDAMSGRRDASEQLIDRMAEALEVDRRALLADPYGATPPLLELLKAARGLAPHLNGHDFGLRAAVEACDEAGL